MLCNHKQYFRLIIGIFYQSRRSFTQTRQLEDLKQIYELLKVDPACKNSIFFLNLFLFTQYFSSDYYLFRKNESNWNLC
jgi:hypothetical protein